MKSKRSFIQVLISRKTSQSFRLEVYSIHELLHTSRTAIRTPAIALAI